MIRPSLSVAHAVPSRRRKLAPALSSPPTIRAIEQTANEPFETDWHFGERAAQSAHDAIDHAAADQRLPDRRGRWPRWTMREQIADRHSQIVIRIQQPRGRRDDAVPIGV